MQKTGNKLDGGGFLQTPDAEFSPAVPWWAPPGNLPAHHADDITHVSSLNQHHQNSEGNKMSLEKGKEAIISSADHQQKDRFEITLAQPMVSHPPQLYGLFSYGPHQAMGPMMLPMSLATNDGTMYVNPKQYHAILRRRESREKAKLKAKPRPFNKPYRHESRHRHAMRRPRGAGGRFLNSNEVQALKGLPTNDTTTNNNMVTLMKNKVIRSSNDHNYNYDHHHQLSSNPSGSSNSEVFQNPNPSGSEATSSLLFYGKQFDWFQPTTDHGCCDFLKV